MAYMPETSLSEHPLAIIGEEDVVSGFKALGFKVYSIQEPQGLKAIFEEVMRLKPLVCLVQDNFYGLLQEKIVDYHLMPLPVFVPFNKNAQFSLLDTIVKEIRLRAMGTV